MFCEGLGEEVLARAITSGAKVIIRRLGRKSNRAQRAQAWIGDWARGEAGILVGVVGGIEFQVQTAERVGPPGVLA